MLNITNNAQTYSIRFFYENAENHDDPNPLENVTHKRIITTCRIAKKTDQGYVYLVEGVSSNHSTDVFRKDVGRKIALARALQCFTPDRTIRKEFWIHYFQNHKEGRKLIKSGRV